MSIGQRNGKKQGKGKAKSRADNPNRVRAYVVNDRESYGAGDYIIKACSLDPLGTPIYTQENVGYYMERLEVTLVERYQRDG